MRDGSRSPKGVGIPERLGFAVPANPRPWKTIKVKTEKNDPRKIPAEKKSGGSDLQVIELPDAIKTVLVRWNRAKIDLTELARLRWIEKMTLSKICQKVGMARSAVQVSTRTIRNCGISGLNLSDSEKKLIEIEMIREIEKLEREQPNFRKSKLARDSRKVVP